MPAHKLRVSVPDASSALDTVTTEIREATGFAARPEFQEVERAELIVELSLAEVGDLAPHQVTQLVQRCVAPGVEVLSTRLEAPVRVHAHPVQGDRVLRVDDVGMPDTVRRAVRDKIPTAGWLPGTVDDRSHWLLAVPLDSVGRSALVGLCRRDGYSIRFSALEASRLSAALAS